MVTDDMRKMEVGVGEGTSDWGSVVNKKDRGTCLPTETERI